MSSLQRQSASQNYTPAMEEGGACEAPEQEFGHATVLDSDLSDREGQVREATENLGEVESLDGGFTQHAGGLVDALLPNEGDKAKLQINVNVPVAAGGAVRASFEFMVQAERDENGIKGRIQIGGGVTATVRGRVFFATVEAFAQAQVYGYMEALGSGGAQMFDHVLLGIQQRIAGVSSNIADAMFSRQQIEEIVGDMREQDYVESGLGASLSAGLGAAVDGKGSSANAGVNGSVGTRLAGDGNGGLQRADVSQITGTLGGSVDPFAVQGSLQGKWTDSQISEVEGKVEGEAMIDADELNEIVMGGRWLSGAIGSVAGLLSGGSGMLQNDDHGGSQVGARQRHEPRHLPRAGLPHRVQQRAARESCRGGARSLRCSGGRPARSPARRGRARR